MFWFLPLDLWLCPWILLRMPLILLVVSLFEPWSSCFIVFALVAACTYQYQASQLFYCVCLGCGLYIPVSSFSVVLLCLPWLRLVHTSIKLLSCFIVFALVAACTYQYQASQFYFQFSVLFVSGRFPVILVFCVITCYMLCVQLNILFSVLSVCGTDTGLHAQPYSVFLLAS